MRGGIPCAGKYFARPAACRRLQAPDSPDPEIREPGQAARDAPPTRRETAPARPIRTLLKRYAYPWPPPLKKGWLRGFRGIVTCEKERRTLAKNRKERMPFLHGVPNWMLDKFRSFAQYSASLLACLL